MDWARLLQTVDGYCERTGPTYWAEPINALTNVAFVIAAFVMWPRTAGMPLARAMCVCVGVIGVGSYLFHTHAQVWAALADVTPIAAFILLYLFALNRHVFGVGALAALGLTALFIPYAAMTVPLFQRIPGFGSSAGYAPVVLLIFLYAALIRATDRSLARGLALGGAVLSVSLAFRTADELLCMYWPTGTHFMWHLLNGVVLAWMIEVYRRCRLGNSGPAR